MSAPFNGPEEETNRPVVIVGGGFAGLTMALKLSREHPRPPIVLVEPRSEFAFLPLLYELLSGELQPWEVAPRYDSLLNSTGIALIQDRVSAVNWQNNELITDAGRRLTYGQLVLATGSQPNDFGVEGVKEHAFFFHSPQDVSVLRQHLKQLRSRTRGSENSNVVLAIVGAGATGVELACKVADLAEGRIAVHLIERGDQILPLARAFNREQAQACLKRLGVHCHLNAQVEEVSESLVRFIENGTSTTLEHQGLVWTAGSSPRHPPLCPEVGTGSARLEVDASLRSVNLPDCLVLGDLATHPNATGEGHLWPNTAQVAMQQGEAAANTVLAMRRGLEPQPFQFQDLGEMLSLGVGNATVTGMGVTLAGPLAFKLRRLTYLARLPKLSLGLRSAGAWLLSR